MKKIRAINKYDPKEIFALLLEGKEVYRINFEEKVISNLISRKVKVLIDDENNHFERYGYFEVLPDEPNAIEDIENVITEIEEEFTLDPPSNKLRLAMKTYGIDTHGKTTRQILLDIIVKEGAKKLEIKC